MKKPLLFCALFLGLFGALWTIQRKREKMTAVILVRYPRDSGFLRVVNGHFQRDPGLTLNRSHILLTTDFDTARGVRARWYDLDAKGLSLGFWENISPTKGWGTMSPPYTLDSNAQLKARQLQMVRNLLKQLPENEAPQSRDDLVLVSFNDGKEWRTQVYDKKALPTALKRLLALLGKREARPY